MAIIFETEAALDKYVRRVINKHIDLAEQSALTSIGEISGIRELAPPALDAIRIAVRVVIAVQRSSLLTALPTVPR